MATNGSDSGTAPCDIHVCVVQKIDPPILLFAMWGILVGQGCILIARVVSFAAGLTVTYNGITAPISLEDRIVKLAVGVSLIKLGY